MKTYFWVKDVINPVLAQLHFPGACKSLVHQNRKNHSCHSWSRQSVFTSKAQTLSVKAEVWLMSWDFQPRWSLFQRTRAFADPNLDALYVLISFNADLVLDLDYWGSVRIEIGQYPQMDIFTSSSADARCCCQVSWSWTGNTKVFSEQFQPDGLLNYKGGATMEPINQVAL